MKTKKAYGITYNGSLMLGSLSETENLAKRWIEAERWACWDLLVGKRDEPLKCVEVTISF
jgi:hypothetical protein